MDPGATARRRQYLRPEKKRGRRYRPPAGGGMWSMRDLRVATTESGRIEAYVRSFGQDVNNELYVLIRGGGRLGGQHGQGLQDRALTSLRPASRQGCRAGSCHGIFPLRSGSGRGGPGAPHWKKSRENYTIEGIHPGVDFYPGVLRRR